MSEHGRKPLLSGRGLVTVEQICSSTGLDDSTIRSLIEAGRLEGVVDSQGRGVGLFEDALPTSEELSALGLSAAGDYWPEDFQSYEVDDNEDEDDTSGPTWSMSW
jgi:hypothetical protein